MLPNKLRLLMLSYLLIVSIFIMHGPVHAETIRVGLSDWPPFSMHEEPIRGLDVDLWKAIANRMGLDLQISSCAWARCLLGLKNGTLDSMNSMAKNEEREKYTKYLISHMNNVTVFYVNEGNANIVTTYSDLYKYTIGFVRGSHYFEPFDSDTKINKYAAVHERQAMNMLLKKRFPVLVGSNPNVEYQLKETGNSGRLVKTVYDPNIQVPLYFSISRKSRFIKMFDKFNSTLKRMVDEGEIENILARYR